MITRQTIDRVFETSRVEEVIREFVQLKKAGSNFKGLSPFTNEKTPSFMVSPVKQIWKDFSTGKGGNVVSFLMEYENYSYPEAIRWLAKKYNIEIEETQLTNKHKEQSNERESMFLVSKFAKDYFHDVLLNTQIGREIGLSYFKERNYNEQIIEKFDLGYCKDQWDNFTTEALKKGYNIKYLKKTGLTIVKEGAEKERFYDRFKGRVMFPIHSMSGRILGFGGRIISNDKKLAKYLNSPESEIYHKSKILYGIYQAKKEISKLDNCYLVEGYTDVISFHQSGIKNVVASSGTALTSDQIRLISRLTKNITVLFDGDDAGIKASIRGIDLILEQGMSVKVITFPKGDDPDSFAKKKSDIELKEYLKEKQQDFIKFKVSLLMNQAKTDPIKKAGLIRNIVTSISKIPDTIQREVYIQECSHIMDISENGLFNELAQIIKKNNTFLDKKQYNRTFKDSSSEVEKSTMEVIKTVNSSNQEVSVNSLEILEKEIIRILLLYGNDEVEFVNWIEVEDKNGNYVLEKEEYVNSVSKELYLNLQEDEIEFTNDIFKEVYIELINQLNQNKRISIDQLTTHENKKISNLVIDILMNEDRYSLSNWKKRDVFITKTKEILPKLVSDVILNLRRVLIEKKIISILKESKSLNDNKKIDLEEITNYTELKKRIFEKLNRVI